MSSLPKILPCDVCECVYSSLHIILYVFSSRKKELMPCLQTPITWLEDTDVGLSL